jgi:type I restriction enzyme S subunit
MVRQGDLIINKIWVRHGAVAIAGNEVDGCAASGEFPTFQSDENRVLPRWLHWICRTKGFWSACADLSRGTSGKNRISPERFLTITIPLPPVDEQQRTAVMIGRMAEGIGEAVRLRKEVSERSDQLCRAILAANGGAPPTPTPMSGLVELRPLDTEVRPDKPYHFAGVYCFGRGVFSGSVKSGAEFSYQRLTRLQAGNFVYPKLMAWEGAVGIVPANCDGLYVSPEFPVFSVHTDRVLPETLDTYFRDPAVWPALGGASTGTNVRRRRMNPKEFLRFRFPLPSMETQSRLRAVRARLDAVEVEARRVTAELDALLPAILDRAFKGEL